MLVQEVSGVVGLHKVPAVAELPIKGLFRGPIEFVPIKALLYLFPVENSLRGAELRTWGQAMGIGHVLPADNDMDMALVPLLGHPGNDTFTVEPMGCFPFQGHDPFLGVYRYPLPPYLV